MTTPEDPTGSHPAEPASPLAEPSDQVVPVTPPDHETPTSRGARSRSVRVAQVAGIVGIVVSLVLAVGVLAGRSWLAGGINDVFAAGDAAFESGIARMDDATGRVAARAAELNELATGIKAAAAESPLPAALAARLVNLSAGYDDLRSRYVAVREQIASAARYVRLAGRLMPGITLPPEPTDALAAFDARMTALDESLSGLRSPALAAGKAQDVAAAVTRLQATAGDITTAAGTVRTAVVEMRASVAKAAGSIDTLLWVVAGGVLLVLAYVALLNGVIVWLARRSPRA